MQLNDLPPLTVLGRVIFLEPPPRQFPEQERFFVQTALLSTISKTTFSEVSSRATVDGGMAFGAGGKVYATSKATETTNRAYIGTHLLPVDDIAGYPPSPAPGAPLKDYRAKRSFIFNRCEWPQPK